MDPNSKRDRRFFSRFIEEVLSSIRSWESTQLHYKDNSKLNKPPKKDLPATINFNTETSPGNNCILSSCGKSHKNKQGKPTRSLMHCSYFANLKLHEKNKLIKEAAMCTKCLNLGNRQKSSISCTTCRSNTHHALVCRNGGKNTKEEAKPKPKGKQESTAHATDAVEDNGSPESDAAEVAEVLPTTENNCLKVFSMTEVEAFLVGKDPVDRQHTMVVGGLCVIKCPRFVNWSLGAF